MLDNFQAVIFDMDGILIDSEPLWRQASMEIFTSLGVEMNEELLNKTSALSSLDFCKVWYSHQPWEGMSFEEIDKEMEKRVLQIIEEKDEHLVRLFLWRKLYDETSGSSCCC